MKLNSGLEIKYINYVTNTDLPIPKSSLWVHWYD